MEGNVPVKSISLLQEGSAYNGTASGCKLDEVLNGKYDPEQRKTSKAMTMTT